MLIVQAANVMLTPSSMSPDREAIGTYMKKIILGALMGLMLPLAACSNSGNEGSGQPGGERPAAAVGVVELNPSEEPVTVVLPGRVVSFRSADIRPQVGGIIKTIAYKEGSAVKKGDLLFKIEDDSYTAALAEAQASLAKAEASVPSAQANVERYQKLVNAGATQMELDSAKVTLLQAKADVASAEASLRSAQINLDHTEIRAPFDGIADVSAFSIGNLVTASQSAALTTLRQVDPIYVDLTDSSVNLLKFRAGLEGGTVQRDVSQAPIHLLLENGAVYEKTGTFDVPKTTVSETTGTFTIRASFPNPDLLLMPGMYVRATVTVGRERGYLIPQRASSRDSDGRLTAKFVSKEGKVETRHFDDARASNNSWLVSSGVNEGDQLIVDGLQSISDGMSVKAIKVTIDENGLVQDAPAAETQGK